MYVLENPLVKGVVVLVIVTIYRDGSFLRFYVKGSHERCFENSPPYPCTFRCSPCYQYVQVYLICQIAFLCFLHSFVLWFLFQCQMSFASVNYFHVKYFCLAAWILEATNFTLWCLCWKICDIDIKINLSVLDRTTVFSILAWMEEFTIFPLIRCLPNICSWIFRNLTSHIWS